jgi:hypothetical protein
MNSKVDKINNGHETERYTSKVLQNQKSYFERKRLSENVFDDK